MSLYVYLLGKLIHFHRIKSFKWSKVLKSQEYKKYA